MRGAVLTLAFVLVAAGAAAQSTAPPAPTTPTPAPSPEAVQIDFPGQYAPTPPEIRFPAWSSGCRRYAAAEQVECLESVAADFGRLARFRAANTALAAPRSGERRVVFFGDSITDNWSRPAYGGFFRGRPYVNRGISGQTTSQMLLRFRPDVIALRPRAVVILAGTNDLAGNTGPVTLEQVQHNLAAMAEMAKANGVRVVLASILPVSDDKKDREGKPVIRTTNRPPAQIRAMNTWLADYAGRNGHVYLDYYAATADAAGALKPELNDDGLHPNAAGYAVMAPLAERAVAQALGEAAPPAPRHAKPADPVVRFEEKDRRIDVTAGGRPFTTYMWPTTLEKPVLHPIFTAGERIVTRAFPPGPGERADHPHHVGLWLNYGDVDGFDFWNNSSAIAFDRVKKMGTIAHEGIVRTEGGPGRGVLEVKADWIDGSGRKVLEESTTYVFHARQDARAIDRITTLRAVSGAVPLEDNKEGFLGLRVRRELEDPAETSGEFADASGKVTKVEKRDSTGVTGVYRTSEGKTGKAVWGTRGKWAALDGTVDGAPLTVAIFDHPDNPGYPTYWHARGYGLFAANPLGPAAFTQGRERLGYTIPAGESRVFRYRVLLLDRTPSATDLERSFQSWTSPGSPLP
jgi:lysophospholipase L1-like esterase